MTHGERVRGGDRSAETLKTFQMIETRDRERHTYRERQRGRQRERDERERRELKRRKMETRREERERERELLYTPRSTQRGTKTGTDVASYIGTETFGRTVKRR